MKTNKETFAIIGGDMRCYYLANALRNDGYNVKLCGFDKLTDSCEIAEALDSDILVLPVIPFENGKQISSPFTDGNINLDGCAEKLSGKLIFTGKKENFLREFPLISSQNVKSYSDNEEFSVKNAVPTAEGAIEEAMKHSDSTISGSKILVCGYGRIGKVLSEMLRGMGADVTISARKKSDLAWIELNGFKGIVTGEFHDISHYSIIFNTVPFLVFNKEILGRISKDALIIDLASKPGGVDFDEAKARGIRTVHALSLPGKTAPRSAGEIIESTILGILEEDDG
ncbi:MAG: dipicolinate synthase subunit DpsA [Ruminococcus sp.]|nr:dipicolinate synthase subunit DpsA [Ruminococcus sp.]